MNLHNIRSSRLDNIGEFLRTAQTYETLGLSRIEGIENFHARCQLLLTNLKKKPYNPLEHRKQDFDVDYQDFKTQLKEFEVRNISLAPSTAVNIVIGYLLCAGSTASTHGPVLSAGKDSTEGN